MEGRWVVSFEPDFGSASLPLDLFTDDALFRPIIRLMMS